ncbi:MAG: phage tail length tape measure family protein [Acetobacteraceae bacterium]
MPLSAEQITVIRSSLDPSGYKAGAEQIVAANQKLAASGETVVQTQTRTTRALVDNGSAFERLKRQIDPTYAATQQFARTQEVLARSVETGRATQEEANRLMLLAQQRFDGAGISARGMAGAADKASLAMRSLGIQSFDVFSQLSSGAPVMTIFIQQGAQVAQVAAAQGVGFGSFATGIRSAAGAINPYVAAAVLAVGAVTTFGIAAEASARRMEALQNSLRGTRSDYAAMAATAEAAARHLAATTTIGTSDARTATGVIVAAPQFQGTQAQLESLVRTAEDMRIMLGETLPDAARLLSKAMGDPAAVIQDMADRRLKGFNQQLADAVRLQQQAGDKAGAFSTFLQAMRLSTAGAAENLTPFQQAVRDLELVFTRTGQSGQSFAEELGTPIVQAAADARTAIRRLIEAVLALKEGFADLIPQSLKDAIAWINAHDPTRMAFSVLTSVGGNGPASALPPTHPSIAAALQSVATSNGVDPLLLARLQASEGLFDPTTGTWKTSSAGAVGPMQVKPDTFAGIARLNPTLGLTDVTDPTQNVVAGAALFAHLLRKYGDVSLAILAYHDGETRIDRVLAGGGTVSPSQGALDQARRVMAGYSGTGLLAAATPAPSPMTDLPVPPIPPSIGVPNAEGIANTDAVADARKLVTGLNLVADAQARIAAQRESLEAGLRAAALAGNQADIDRFTQGLAALSGEFYRAVSPQEDFIRGLERQAQTAGVVTEADRKIAQTLQQIAELDREHPENASTADQRARAVNAVLAEQSGAYRLLTHDLDVQIGAQQRLAAAHSQGTEVVARATAGAQAFEQALKLFPAGSVQFQAALAGLTDKYLTLARAQAEVRIAQQTAANDNQITLIQAEAATLGMSNDARAVLLARLRAEQELKQQAIPIEGALGQAYLASVEALTRETLAFDRQKAALDDIAGSFSQSFDTIGNAITQALLSGQGAAVNWRNVMTSVSQQVLQQFLKLAVLNPLLNNLFGGSRTTIGDVFSALGGGGSGTSGAGMFGLLGQFGGLFGPSASTLANLTGATASGLGTAALTASTGILVGGVHSGGLVGVDPWTFTRTMPANDFAGAPRHHSGLGADEFAAILQRGERVLTANQNNRLAATLTGLTTQGERTPSQAPTIVFNITTPDADSFLRSRTQIMGQAAAALGRATRKTGARG